MPAGGPPYVGFLVALLLSLLRMSHSSSKAESSCTTSALKMLSIFNDHLQSGLLSCSADSSLLPYTTISYAQTLDGTIAPLKRTRLDISSKCSFQLLHSLRSLHDAVLIGVNTLVSDKPRLTVRDPLPSTGIDTAELTRRPPDYQPRPVVIDSRLRFLCIPTSDILLSNPIICTCILPSDEKFALAERKLAELGGGSLMTCSEDASSGHCDLRDAFLRLRRLFGFSSILVEGGAGIIQSVLEAGLASRIVVTIKPSFFGGYRALIGQLSNEVKVDCPIASSIGGDIVMQGNLVMSHAGDGSAGDGGGDNSRTVVDFVK